MDKGSDALAQVLTPEELAEFLSVKPGTVIRLAKLGQMPAFRVGHRWRFDVEAVREWLGGDDEDRQ